MYRVTKDGTLIGVYKKEFEAKKVLRNLVLGNGENGYLDECDENGNHVFSCYQKLTTSGKLLECW